MATMAVVKYFDLKGANLYPSSPSAFIGDPLLTPPSAWIPAQQTAGMTAVLDLTVILRDYQEGANLYPSSPSAFIGDPLPAIAAYRGFPLNRPRE